MITEHQLKTDRFGFLCGKGFENHFCAYEPIEQLTPGFIKIRILNFSNFKNKSYEHCDHFFIILSYIKWNWDLALCPRMLLEQKTNVVDGSSLVFMTYTITRNCKQDVITYLSVKILFIYSDRKHFKSKKYGIMCFEIFLKK